jgi:hypothetical protein
MVLLVLRLECIYHRARNEMGVITWPTLIHDFCKLEAVHLTLDGKYYLVNMELSG